MKISIAAATAAALMLATPPALLAQESGIGAAANKAGESASVAEQQGQSALNNATDQASDISGDTQGMAESASQQATSPQNSDLRGAEEGDQSSASDRGDMRPERNADRAQQASDRWNDQDRDANQRSDWQRQQPRNQRNRQQFTEQQRTAPWRFVQQNGVWWYRTPMNTWMIHRGGQWQPGPRQAAYRSGVQRGDQYQQYQSNGANQNEYAERPVAYDDENAYQGKENSRDGDYSDSSQTSGQHPSVGKTEWMCIDGRMRRVTVVSVTPSSNDAYGQPTPAGQQHSGQQTAYESAPAPPAPGEQNAANRTNGNQQQGQNRRQGQDYGRGQALSPPPAPQPNDASQPSNQDRPQAPSSEQLNRSSGAATSQSRTANKPVVDDSSAANSAMSEGSSEDSLQAPPTPQPASSPSYATGGSTERDDSYETDADRNAGRIEAADIRDLD